VGGDVGEEGLADGGLLGRREQEGLVLALDLALNRVQAEVGRFAASGLRLNGRDAVRTGRPRPDLLQTVSFAHRHVIDSMPILHSYSNPRKGRCLDTYGREPPPR
jgi:hypothetical protein